MTSSRGVDVGTVGNCRGRWGIVGNCGELWGRVGMFHTTVLITPLPEASVADVSRPKGGAAFDFEGLRRP